MRFANLAPFVVIVVAGLLAGCGGDAETSAPPGSPKNPLVGKTPSENEGASEKKPGPSFDTIVQNQSSKPQRRFSPCNLVSRSQAKAIVKAPVDELVEAPQGPTCIYQSPESASFVTLSVQPGAVDQLKRRLGDRKAVDVADRTAYCGRLGQPQLYVPLSGGRVLTVSARCAVATRFAATALRQLD
jgi:hypothetical protein